MYRKSLAVSSYCWRSLTFGKIYLDAVIRTIFYKYFDPKEALISNGILNRAIATAAGKQAAVDQNANAQLDSFLFPTLQHYNVVQE